MYDHKFIKRFFKNRAPGLHMAVSTYFRGEMGIRVLETVSWRYSIQIHLLTYFSWKAVCHTTKI